MSVLDGELCFPHAAEAVNGLFRSDRRRPMPRRGEFLPQCFQKVFPPFEERADGRPRIGEEVVGLVIRGGRFPVETQLADVSIELVDAVEKSVIAIARDVLTILVLQGPQFRRFIVRVIDWGVISREEHIDVDLRINAFPREEILELRPGPPRITWQRLAWFRPVPMTDEKNRGVATCNLVSQQVFDFLIGLWENLLKDTFAMVRRPQPVIDVAAITFQLFGHGADIHFAAHRFEDFRDDERKDARIGSHHFSRIVASGSARGVNLTAARSRQVGQSVSLPLPTLAILRSRGTMPCDWGAGGRVASRRIGKTV